jgi:hypothetical protein
MKDSLYDKYVDEHGFVDFTRSGGMSHQKELKRLMSALNKQSELQQKDWFSRAVRNYASKIVLLKSSWSAGYFIIQKQIRQISFLKIETSKSSNPSMIEEFCLALHFGSFVMLSVH